MPAPGRLNIMVNLTRIYTRTGDAGKTRLSDNSVAPKTDPRVEPTVRSTNSILPLACCWPNIDSMRRPARRWN